jgi:glycine/D-amino acid oxidase-like deaminating enzyme
MHLARGGAQVTLVDPRPPLTATSQYSTECYRNFFIDNAMVPFMGRSIDIMEELAGDENMFNLNRRGYAFLSASAGSEETFERFATIASGYGAGPVRKHSHDSMASYVSSPPTGYKHPGLDGFDIVYGSEAIRKIFPFVTERANVMLHARRCGWMDSVGFGQAMLRAAKMGTGAEDGSGAHVLQGKICGFDISEDQVRRVHVARNSGGEVALDCDAFVNAAGAWMQSINTLLAPGAALPLTNEVHAKTILHDTSDVIPQDTAPFMVWRDATPMNWDEDTVEGLRELDDTSEGGIVNSASWLKTQPGGQHLRPAGNGRVLLLWEHMHRHISLPMVPDMPVSEFLEMYPQLCVTGLQEMVPALGGYDGCLGRGTTVDGGYYTVTPDARPLISPHGARNAFVCGGMGTYGLMGAAAAGELASLHVFGNGLPSYSGACVWPRQMPPPEFQIDLLDDSA